MHTNTSVHAFKGDVTEKQTENLALSAILQRCINVPLLHVKALVAVTGMVNVCMYVCVCE